MPSISRYSHLAMIVSLFALVSSSPLSLAKEKELTPEALVTQHLQSLGSPDLLAKIQTRASFGAAKVRFVQGAFGELNGQGQFVSDGRKLGIVLKFDGQDYRGEHFAYDGKDVTIARFLPGRISTLAEFVNRFGGLMKEGLLGGALSTAWPLWRFQEIKSRLKCNKAKLSGHMMHTLEYRAKGGLGDFRIVMYFEPETFHHIRTEYKLHISASIGRGAATSIGIERSDSNYLLSEEFTDFTEVDGITLPHRYTIGFSSEGQMRSFLAYWTLEAQKWIHNTQIDPVIFKAPVY